MKVLAIDPGTTRSAMCIMDKDTLEPLDIQLLDNNELHEYIKEIHLEEEDEAAIEMLQSYGNVMGKHLLFTAVWIGRFYEQLRRKMLKEPTLIYRKDERIHITNNTRAGDSEIMKALIKRFARHDFKTGKGTKKNPDFFYGFKYDIWAAYAVGLTFIEKKLEE